MRYGNLMSVSSFSVWVAILSASLCFVGCDSPAEESPTQDTAQLGLTTHAPKPVMECGTKTLIEDVCAAEAYWVSRAETKCESRGWELTQYSLLSKCKAKGKYGYSDIKFQCCGEVMAPEPEVIKPEETDEVAACFTDEVDSKECRGEGGLLADAASICGDNAMDVAQYTVANACKVKGKKGFRSIKFECCAASLETADDISDLDDLDSIDVDGCWEAAMGGPETCSPVSALEEKALAACTNSNQVLSDFGLSGECKTKKGKGYRFAKFQCCDKPLVTSDLNDEVEEVEEVAACSTDSMGGVSVCVSEKDFAAKLKVTCGAQDQLLTAYEVSTPCKTKKNKGYRFAKFQCCDAPEAKPSVSQEIADKPAPKKTAHEASPSDSDTSEKGKDKSIKTQPKTN
jgi:hypothetical protein